MRIHGHTLAGLHGHIILANGILGQLGDDQEFDKSVVDTFGYLLRAQFKNGNPAALPWVTQRVEGETGVASFMIMGGMPVRISIDGLKFQG